jgi:hypothetical protein
MRKLITGTLLAGTLLTSLAFSQIVIVHHRRHHRRHRHAVVVVRP